MSPIQILIGQLCAHQTVNSEQGTAKSSLGAIERLSEPDFIDIISPFFAFSLVIVLPSIVALWVIYKTITEKTEPPTPSHKEEPSTTSPSNT